MSRRAAAWLAWSLLALSVVLFAAGVAVGAQVQPDGGARGLTRTVAIPLSLLPFAAIGALIAARRPENPTGWAHPGARRRAPATGSQAASSRWKNER